MIRIHSMISTVFVIFLEVLFTIILLLFNPYLGILLLLFLFLLVEKIDLLKVFMRFEIRRLSYFLPILIEYLIILFVCIYLIKRRGIYINFDLSTDVLLSFLPQRIASMIIEELITSFSWFTISFQIISLRQKSTISPKQIRIITVTLAFLFGIGHLSKFYFYPEALSAFGLPAIQVIATVYNAFCLGYYLKTLFIKSVSLPMVVVAHILINLPRYLNDLYEPEVMGPEFSIIYTILLIPSLYLLYSMLFLQRQDGHPSLQLVLNKFTVDNATALNETGI